MVKTVGEKLVEIRKKFEEAGISSAALDAVMLTAGALGVGENNVRLNGGRALAKEDVIDGFVARRLQKEPVSKILHAKGFWKFDFYVDENVLDPRPDSETLIESVLRHFPNVKNDFRILDLGTGSGCLILSLLKEYANASGIGVDFSPKALDVAVRNACALGVSARFAPVCADWSSDGFSALFNRECFDIIVANPPYISLAEKDGLPEDTLFDPPTALFAADNGLKAYRDIAARLNGLLKADGKAFFECGQNQARAVCGIVENAGGRVFEICKDLAQIERCVCVGR